MIMAGAIQDSPEGKCWMGIQSMNCEQPQHSWDTGSALPQWYKPQVMGKIQREVLGSRKHHMHMDHRPNRALYHVLSRTQRISRSTYICYLFPTYFYLCLSHFPVLYKICLFPITFPNRSLYYSRNCQGKKTTKHWHFSFSILRPQRWFSWRLGLTMFLWWICWYFLFRDEGCWWQTWGGCKW